MISIVIPIYNAAAYLQKCLDSVVNQTQTDWEAILINDGSTDNSGDICESYINRDSRFRLFNQSNSGVSIARNTGLDNVRGEWVLFLDSDDILPKDALATFTQVPQFSTYDMIIGGYETYDMNGERTYWIDERITKELDRDEAVSLMYEPVLYHYLGYICGKLFKTSGIQLHQLRFNPSICFNEDRLFNTQFMLFSSRFLFFSSPVYYSFEHPGSAMASLYSGFNEKYITDFDAMILMREAIAKDSPANLGNATKGIADSYWRFQGMMNQFHANSVKRLFYLHKKLAKILSLKEYYQFIIQPFFKKIRKRIFHGN